MRKDLAAANNLCDQLRSSTATTDDMAEELAEVLSGAFVEARSGARARQDRRERKVQHAVPHQGASAIRWAAASRFKGRVKPMVWPMVGPVPQHPGIAWWQPWQVV